MDGDALHQARTGEERDRRAMSRDEVPEQREVGDVRAGGDMDLSGEGPAVRGDAGAVIPIGAEALARITLR